MRCYFDESWQRTSDGNQIGVLFGLIIKKKLIEDLDNHFYRIRKKYFGKDHAKDKTKDIKGKDLLSNNTFKIVEKTNVMPNNHCVAMEMISWCRKQTESNIPKAFASIVYGRGSKLTCANPKKLELPFRDLCVKISTAAEEIAENTQDKISIIFDQRFGVQNGIAISMYNFIQGSKIKNINPFSYFAVSNVEPGIQLADLFAYIVGKRAIKDSRFLKWYNEIKPIQWRGKVKEVKHDKTQYKLRYGFQRYDSLSNGNFKIRKEW